MFGTLQWLGAICSLDGVAGGGLGLYGALFVGGLAGSVVHCAPMCGPFVFAQVSSRLAATPAHRLCERQRLTNGVLAPYHAGRLCTYALLGALAAGSGAAFAGLPGLGRLPGVLLLLGAALFLMQALGRIVPAMHPLAKLGPHAAVPWAGWLARLARRIDRSRPQGGFLLGVVLGFLPCGFLYAALAIAAATARPLAGALAMAAFGLGTVPSLVVLGIAGQAGGRAWSRYVMPFAPAILLVNAGVLTVLAWQRLSVG